MATKSELAKVRDANIGILDILINHDKITNERLDRIQTQAIELDGKIVGMQIEMRQGFGAVDTHLSTVDVRFDAVDTRFGAVDARFDVVDSRFDRLEALLAQVIERLPAKP